MVKQGIYESNCNLPFTDRFYQALRQVDSKSVRGRLPKPGGCQKETPGCVRYDYLKDLLSKNLRRKTDGLQVF